MITWLLPYLILQYLPSCLIYLHYLTPIYTLLFYLSNTNTIHKETLTHTHTLLSSWCYLYSLHCLAGWKPRLDHWVLHILIFCLLSLTGMSPLLISFHMHLSYIYVFSYSLPWLFLCNQIYAFSCLLISINMVTSIFKLLLSCLLLQLAWLLLYLGLTALVLCLSCLLL